MKTEAIIYFCREWDEVTGMECLRFAPNIRMERRMVPHLRDTGQAELLLVREDISTEMFSLLREALYPGISEQLSQILGKNMQARPENVEFKEVNSLELGAMQKKINEQQARIDQLKGENCRLQRDYIFWRTMLSSHFKPLFIPLTKRWYEEFASGRKDIEYRKAGKRWNLNTCFHGREVVLSCGYGKSRRMKGIIEYAWVETDPNEFSDDYASVYGRDGNELCIKIKIAEG